ncbi:ATPase, T2SS/T4P/T4SS family [Pseudomonas mosselii]|uniref:Flp pilus assembly complex ATPase component TadA n=1 Tax=Pseudomonas mosselii TaxID=78327 RepID=A0A7W2Q137_9PSED|nr:ATPase, T2SS/T4P/T4SS family [Pseudomonas mosselii]MBA6068118.1 Flp pilus assembly complex ATPase component TadA [Pseudomonas mosselii]
MDNLQSKLSTTDFVDLYLSDSFADVKGLAGASSPRVPVPEEWSEEVAILLAACRKGHDQSGQPEFSIVHGKVVYRVTYLDSSEPGGMYVLRRSKAELRALRSIGIPGSFVDAMLAKDAIGLILICGGFGVGKTSTGGSWVIARLTAHGGISLSIEDPIETNTRGLHGNGRSIQVEANQHNGGYREQLRRGLRSGVDFLFLGEIRDGETAFEALKAGSNGELIAATFHASDPIAGLQRLIALASEHAKAEHSVEKLLATSLLGVLWLDLVEDRNDQGEPFKRIETSTLLVQGDHHAGVREKIRTGNMTALNQDIQQQANQQVWGGNMR